MNTKQKIYDTIIEQVFLAMGALEKSIELMRMLDDETADKLTEFAVRELTHANKEDEQ